MLRHTLVLTFFQVNKGTVFGAEIMNWPQLGPILAIVVMGAVIITSLEKGE